MNIPRLSHVQKSLGLRREPDKFETLRRSISVLTRKSFKPDVMYSPPQKYKKMEELKRRLLKMHPDILEREEEIEEALIQLIKKAVANDRGYWLRLNRPKDNDSISVTSKRSRRRRSDAAPTSSKPDVIDLTFSENDEDDSDMDDSNDYQSKSVLTKKEPSTIALQGVRFANLSTHPQPELASSSANSSGSVRDRQYLRNFLASCEPRMDALFNRLWNLGVRTEADIMGLARWSTDQRREFFKKMNLDVDETGLQVVTELQMWSLEHRFSTELS